MDEHMSQGDLYSLSLETEKQELIKDIFETVYQWGRFPIKYGKIQDGGVDENAPTYQAKIQQLLDLEDLIESERKGVK